ncbi:MAG: sel1 repeat family protein [Gammaproteobacteria bacterium]|nr:sel1 repeat family protein [Gammaproteobacteria bacterium]
MIPHSLYLPISYRANIARQLGVPNVSLHNYEGMLEPTDRKIAISGLHLFFLDNLMGGLENRSVKKFKLQIAQRIVSKLVRLVRDRAAKEAEELCALGQCLAAQVPLQLAIELGHLPSRALMAWLLIEGREGVAKDEDAAFELAEEGVRMGCHHCQGVMAEYLSWFNSPQWLELACKSSENSSRYGQLALGELYFSGRLGVMLDYDKAVALFRLAAAQGLDMAQWRLGYMYFRGYGVAQDYTEALQFYQLAAAQGHPGALYMVAFYHKLGRGVPKNEAEAIRWYKRAKKAGHSCAADALKRLGALE